MSRNGSGTYNLPAGNPVVTGTTITSTWANNTLTDIANTLTSSVASDGQTPMSGALNMATSKIISLGTPTLSTDAVTKAYADALVDGSASGSFVNLAYTGTLTGGTGIVNLGSGQFYKDASGNIGIGTSSPSTPLHIVGTTRIARTGASTQFADLSCTASTGFNINVSASSGAITMSTDGGTTGMVTLNGSGNVGIGTSSPAFALDVRTSLANIRVAPSAPTNNALTRYVNTGGTGYVGLDNSVGGLGGAYALNIWHSGAYPIVFATSDTERMRIDSSGNVGIGTTSPTSPTGYRSLNIESTSGAEIQLRNTAVTAQSSIYCDATGLTNINYANTNFLWIGGSTEKMRIDSSGNVGIGTSSPNASAILDAQSTTKGVRMPNMTTTQKNAISSPAAGLIVFDTTLAKLCVYTGSAWQTITSA